MIKHITDLLYLHDCVIVPKFGGFVGNYCPAFLSDEQNLFCPPNKEIGFNKILSYNDGLLANFISRRESIKYEQAVEQINQFVKDLQSKLLQGNTIEFGDIGFFKRDVGGNLFFTPKEESTFLPDALGLTSFRFFPLEQKRITKIEFQDDVLPTIKKPSIRNWAAAAVFAAFFIFSTDLKMPEISYSGIFYDFFNYPDKTALLSENNNITEVDIEDKLENNLSEKSENSISENFEININSEKYHIIGASYTRYNQAETAIKRFNEEFPNATILDNGKGNIRISLISFLEKEEAISVMEEMRKKNQFSTVWLLKK
jgi:hypothetical protein